MGHASLRGLRALSGWGSVGLLLGSLAFPVWSQQQGFGSAAAAAAVQQRGPANAMAEAAQLVGVRRCLPALSRLSGLSLQGAVLHDVVLDWDRQAPDAAPFFGLMGVVEPQSGVHAATLTAIPEGTGDCTVLAERMAWAPKMCALLAREELPGYTVAQLVPGMAVLTHSSDVGSTISLLDAGPGCMVVRRYVQYRWRDPSAPVVPAAPTFTGPRPTLPTSR